MDPTKAKAAAAGFAEAFSSKFASTMEKVGDATYKGLGFGVKIAAGMGEFVSRGIEYDAAKYSEHTFFNSRFTKNAERLLIGGALVSGTIGAYHDYETTQMGTPTGEVVTAAPRIEYTRFGEEMGATGDLVFAMNRNRRG